MKNKSLCQSSQNFQEGCGSQVLHVDFFEYLCFQNSASYLPDLENLGLISPHSKFSPARRESAVYPAIGDEESPKNELLFVQNFSKLQVIKKPFKVVDTSNS